MPTTKADHLFELPAALLQAFATNNRINTFLIEAVPEGVWTAPPPGGKGRKIASIVAHLHNVRLMWLKAAGAKDMPAKLEPEATTKEQALVALEESWRASEELVKGSMAAGGRVKGFKPDVVSFFAYLVAHDAHHRGQITMLARQLGSPISQSAMFGLWEWGTR